MGVDIMPFVALFSPLILAWLGAEITGKELSEMSLMAVYLLPFLEVISRHILRRFD